ncbi:cupin domain-containing protein [Amnibacterium setariae]|uniref:Cupin n=1 Tax=Amnibacterium setariae TaxID=2306585 RepID=A0A3A1U7P6_9MICO|nr:cupin domain-containing protein [Amnibacterium setariae]RIX31068.1 cupin [Amnibacterium setariae]
MTTEGEPSDRPALSRCIAVPADRFAAEIWGRRALLSPAEDLSRGFDDLLTADAVDELLADRALRTPFIRMAKEGVVLPPSAYTAPGGFGAEVADQVSTDRVLAEFAAGATIVLQGLHRTWKPLRDFSRQLILDLGHPVQINAYITPAQSRGFDPHYDVHDVFVLQISGEKRWVVHEPVREHPFADEPWSQRAAAVAARAAETPAIETVLRPGDALYLPSGWIHSAVAQGGTTVHITVGMPALTLADVGRDLMETALRSDPLREPLPVGVDVRDPAQLADAIRRAADALVAALAEPADPGRAAEVLGRRLTRMTRPEPVRPLATVDALAALHPDATVRWRHGLRTEVESTAAEVALRLPDRVLHLPPQTAAAIDALRSGRAAEAGALAELDEHDSLVVARRLLREGVLVVDA